jgi:hypothetical protein
MTMKTKDKIVEILKKHISYRPDMTIINAIADELAQIEPEQPIEQEKEEYFRKIFIKSEADLPPKSDWYFTDRGMQYFFSRADNKWCDNVKVDWYLQPKPDTSQAKSTIGDYSLNCGRCVFKVNYDKFREAKEAYQAHIKKVEPKREQGVESALRENELKIIALLSGMNREIHEAVSYGKTPDIIIKTASDILDVVDFANSRAKELTDEEIETEAKRLFPFVQEPNTSSTTYGQRQGFKLGIEWYCNELKK